MKRLILFFIALLFLVPSAYAGECNKITDVNDYWVEVKSGVNIRDQVCDGNVVGSLSTGTKVKVTGHIEDWRYIQTPEGGVGFIWSDFHQAKIKKMTALEVKPTAIQFPSAAML